MDVVTYALLKKKIAEITGDFVTSDEMNNAIATATTDMATEDYVASTITTAIAAIIAGFDYKGSVATVSALPASGTLGDCYTVDENLGTYVWDGTKWFQYYINLDLILKAGTEETADYHLGFYYDSDGDLAQVDD